MSSAGPGELCRTPPNNTRSERVVPGRSLGDRGGSGAELDGEAEALTRKAVTMALAGDMTALRLCMERIYPARKDTPVCFDMPELETAADAMKAMAAIMAAVASGDLTPAEANELGKLVDTFTRAIEAHELDERLRRLESATK